MLLYRAEKVGGDKPLTSVLSLAERWRPRGKNCAQAAEESGGKAAGLLTSETLVMPALRTNTPRRTGDRSRPPSGLWGLSWK